MKLEKTTQSNYTQLINQIGDLLTLGREKVAYSINTILLQTYWEIGRYIVEFEQNGNEKAEYGTQLFERLSSDLTTAYGKGFGRSNLLYMRKLYLTFQISGTLSHKLTWSHYYEILKSDSELEIGFYVKQTEKEKWSVRELKRQMKSMLFPNIPEQYHYFESDLEEKLISNLQQFLLEIGKGFAFMARQHRMSIGGKHFRVDLLFYHRILKCFVLIDLKRGEIDHQDIGQMNLYLNYLPDKEQLKKALNRIIE